MILMTSGNGTTNGAQRLISRFSGGLSFLKRVLNEVVASLNALGALLIIAMMCLICADVIGRNLLNASLPGVVELTELGIVSIVFLQISDALRTGRLMRSDGLLNLIILRRPRLGALLSFIFDITGAALFYLIANGGFSRFHEALEGAYYIGNKGAFTAPTWPMEIAVSLGATVMAILFCTSALGNLAIISTGTTPRLNKENAHDRT